MFFKPAAVLSLLLVLSLRAVALEVPELQTRVTDLSGTLTSDEKTSLEARLQELETTDSTQIAVLIIPSLEGESLESYSIRVVEAWKLGQKEKNNGALLLIALNDRKVRIEAGYGLEQVLTDLMSGRIIRNEITPRFKAGDYYGGIDAGITAIIQTVHGAYKGNPESEKRRSGSGNGFLPLIFIFIPLLWILSKIAQKSGRGSGGFGGPFIGGGGGGFSGGGFGGGGGFSGGGGGFGGGGSSGSW
jgi:uncharacterized protein